MTTPTKKPNALLRSTYVFRAIVTGITLTTFTGMSAFAASHVQNAAAPLQPSADWTTASAATATPAPTARRRTTVTGQVPTTTAAPRTRTRRS